MATKTLGIILVVIACIILMPVGIGIIGGVVGLIAGLIGGIIGVVAGIFGAIFGAIFGIFGWLFDGLFGWHNLFSYSFNLLTVVLIIGVVVLVTRGEKRRNVR